MRLHAKVFASKAHGLRVWTVGLGPLECSLTAVLTSDLDMTDTTSSWLVRHQRCRKHTVEKISRLVSFSGMLAIFIDLCFERPRIRDLCAVSKDELMLLRHCLDICDGCEPDHVSPVKAFKQGER